ncbi:unnamed protein product [Didymodactylos carnosus]|uniref:Uncharacterized protein n=1 Tax=Didymodactylos carnosus TaxID=1234261 RepID=A0A814XPE4_9BILA|nr:unnamed protein product [Didymodactylos carnosus]CAF1215573.1 unnamed protein product [Didymodactylos carnosus]CAF3791124.1 unnamed protein product [Didymodactylos carnosus]CAF3979410.1 unnamed protein product [Didymodactylos carnosus]
MCTSLGDALPMISSPRIFWVLTSPGDPVSHFIETRPWSSSLSTGVPVVPRRPTRTSGPSTTASSSRRIRQPGAPTHTPVTAKVPGE